VSARQIMAYPLTAIEESAVWSTYCTAYAMVVKADETPAAWEGPAAAALALGAHDRSMGNDIRTRPALLAEVARLCGEQVDAAEDLIEAKLEAYGKGQEQGARDERKRLLDELEAIVSRVREGLVLSPKFMGDWIASQRKAGAS